MSGIEELKKQCRTQCELADMLEVKQSTVSEWFSGKKNVSPKMAKKIEQMFGIARESIRPDVFGG